MLDSLIMDFSRAAYVIRIRAITEPWRNCSIVKEEKRDDKESLRREEKMEK